MTKDTDFQNAAKALIFDEDKVLILKNARGAINFPGGMVEDQKGSSAEESLKEILKEQVGEDVEVEVGEELFVAKRSYNSEGRTHHIASTFYKCQYKGGNVKISDEYVSFEWITIEKLLNTNDKFVSMDEQKQVTKLLSTS